MGRESRKKTELDKLLASRVEIDAIEEKVSMWLHEDGSFTSALFRLSQGEIDLLLRSKHIHETIATLQNDPELDPGNLSDDDV